MGSSERHESNYCAIEYGLKVNEKKSTALYINGEVGRRRCKIVI